MKRTFAIFAALALFTGLAIGIGHAYANEGESGNEPIFQGKPMPGPEMMNGKKPEGQKPMMGNEGIGDDKNGTSFGIKPSGEVMIQKGKVTASSGSSVTVTVLGFPITVGIGASSTIQNGTSTVFAVGDSLDIRGVIDPATGAITARMIKSDAANNQAVQSLKDQIQKLMEQLKKLRPNFSF